MKPGSKLAQMARQYCLQPEDFYDLIAIGRFAMWKANQEGRNPWHAAMSDMSHYRRDKARTIRVPAWAQEPGKYGEVEFPGVAPLIHEPVIMAPDNTEREALDRIRCRELLKRFKGKARILVAAYMDGMGRAEAHRYADIPANQMGYEGNIRKNLEACGYG